MSEPADKTRRPVGGRTETEWEAMSLDDLRAEQVAGKRGRADDFARLTRVRGEIFARLNTKPPDGLTWAAKGKAS